MSSCPGSVDLECQSQKAVLMEGGSKSSSTQKKWRLLLAVHRASQIIVSSSKADKADHKEPTEIVQVLPTSTDHSQVSIDASNGIPDDEKHLYPRCIDKEEQAPAQAFLEAICYKKRVLAVLFLLLEIISFVLDKIGGSNRLFLVALFLLSAIIFVTTIYTSYPSRTVAAVTRWKSERQLIAVEIVFSLIQLVLTYIQLIRIFLGAKSSSSSNESLFPLAFAVISVVFNFRNNEEAQVVSDSASVSQIISPETTAVDDGSAIKRVSSTLRQRTKSTQSNNQLHNFPKAVMKVELHDERDKKKAVKMVSSMSGVDSIQMDMKDRKLTVVGDIDPVEIVVKLRKIFHTEIVSVGPS